MEHKSKKSDETSKNKILVCREFGDKKLIDILADLIAKRIKANKLAGTDSNQSKQILHI